MKRRLTLRFERSISGPVNGDKLEVVVTPLNTANDPDGDVTLFEEKQAQRVTVLNEVTAVFFDLTPTYDPGLTEPIFYRIAWRIGYVGRITTRDFSMPDQDVDFDDLGDLGNIITGENYLREEDLGVVGRVARLNNVGEVVDANGNPVGGVELTGVNELISQEIRDRQTGDADIDRRLTIRLETQVSSLQRTIGTVRDTAATNTTNAVAAEKLERENADLNLQNVLDTNNAQSALSFSAVNSTLNSHTNALATKASLVGGKVPTSQLPAVSITARQNVADQAAMLALTPTQVQPGDLAVRPDGNWILVDADPSQLSSWVPLTSGGNVASVNGQIGVVLLDAQDVGARSQDVAIPMSDINGLSAALTAKANASTVGVTNTNVANLTARVTTAEGNITTLDGLAIKKVGGLLPTSLLDSDVPRVNGLNQIIKKDGTVIPTGGTGGGGGGAVDSVNGKIGTVVLNATDVNARSASVAIPQADINNLAATLALKTDVSTTQNLTTRVSRNEVDIADLIAAGPGGGGSTGTKTAVTYVANAGTTPSLVTVKSPFGLLGGTGAPYYDPNGAIEGEAAVPYIDENGYLYLRRLNSAAAPAPLPATQATVSALTTRVTNLEGIARPGTGWTYNDMSATLKTSLDKITNATPSSSADSLVLRNAAGTFAVGEPTGTSHPATKNYTDTALALKATTASVTALTTTINSKAAQADLTALTTRVTNTENTFPNKADLDGSSKVPINQIPQLSGANITGWASKADLDGGNKVPIAQIPTGIPQASVANLVTTLAAKADLVLGKVPTSQLPALTTNETYVKANRAAMLALTSAEVQVGDICVITTTSDQGSYILNASDPSVFANWVLLAASSGGGAGAVASVNGQTGVVVLGAADVGARSTSVSIPQADVTNLISDLALKSTITYVDAQVLTRTTPAAVTTQINAQSVTKVAADYVATSAVSLSGAQSVDGVLVGAGKRVLLTSQASSAQNGVWVTASGAWTRATDQVSGSTFMPSTLVAVKTGVTHNNSVWQITTTTAGTVDTNAQNWAKVLQGGQPLVYTGGNGVDVSSGQVVSVKLAATSPGLISDANGLRLDTAAVIRKYVGVLPSGGTTTLVDHNLNTTDLSFSMWEISTGNLVLVAPTILNANQLSIETGATVGSNQYKICVIG